MNLKKPLIALLLLLAALPAAAHVNVFGPKAVTAAAGAPQTMSETFTLSSSCDLGPNAVYTLVIGVDGVSSASIRINGTEVVKESDFNQQVTIIERPVTLAASNTLSATLKGGSRNGSITIAIHRHIEVTEAVFGEKTYTTTGKSDTFRDSFNVANATGTFSIAIRDGATPVRSAEVRLNGAEVTSGQTVTLRAANELVIDTKSDGAGASLRVAIVRHVSDLTGPQITHGLTEGQTIASSPLTISGTVTDPTGVASFTANGTPVTVGPAGAFSTSVALVEGSNTIRFDATDCEGNTTHREVRVVLEVAPTLTITTPAPNALSGSLTIAMSGTVSSTTGIQSVTANGTAMTVSGTSWSGNVTLAGGADGAREITVVATDTAGRQTTKSVTVRLDTTGPVVQILSPSKDGITIYIGTVSLSGTVSDALATVATVACNGVPGTMQDGYFHCASVPLQPGVNTITVRATDSLGNAATGLRSLTRQVDTTPPTIAAEKPPANEAGWYHEPLSVLFRCNDDHAVVTCTGLASVDADGAAQTVNGTAVDAAGLSATASTTVSLDTTLPQLDVTSPSEVFSGAATVTISGTASDALSGLHSVVCGSTAATLSGNAFTCSAPLAAGHQSIYVTARDVAGNEVSTRVAVRYDSTDPVLTLAEPLGPVITNNGTLTVTGLAQDDDQIASVTVGGVSVPVSVDGVFSYAATLAEGEQLLAVRATDRSGNDATVNINVNYVRRGAIRITSPADFAVTNAPTVTVSGTIQGPITSVHVNDVPAAISGGTFTAASVPLAQGRTNVTAFATTAGGEIVTDQLNLYRDSIPPRVTVYSPEAESTVTSSPVVVAGMVDDIVIGTINAGEVRVTVNGVNATVANRAFVASNIPLAAGLNTLSIVATDQAGNSFPLQHRVTLSTTPATRIAITGGDMQTAVIGATLPQPLRARVTNAAGTAVAGAEVTFTVTQNDGELSGNGQTGRTITVPTDATGVATAQWTIGNRAGAGNNSVEASVAGAAAPAVFHATATNGAPALVVVDSGDNQFGVSNERLQRPLVAVVVDAGNNRLGGVPVTFDVLEGGGSFSGQQRAVAISDEDGRAWATPTLGPGNGNSNNAFSAAVAGVINPATFRASGRVAGPVEETRLSGVVLDNTNLPIAGVTMRIDETNRSTRTDAQGQFSFDNAPVGYVKLIADGSTVERPGTWPMLEFILYTNAGQNNTIGMPVYMLPIDVTRGIQVTETTGGTLTMPELPGFSLTVKPGSALFPNGSRAGTVSATLVHSDKVPMTPGFGQQPRFIVTIQPPGVHFDPPAAMTLPNLEGLAPGEVTEMYSFDHDLGQFIAIGTASVSEDGTVIASDPGVGIIKGGWHCGGNPNPTGSACTVTLDLEGAFTGDDPTDDWVTASATAPGPSVASNATAAPLTAAPDVPIEAHLFGDPVGLVGTCHELTAKGLPIINGQFHSWQISNMSVATWAPTPANCSNASECKAKIRGLDEGEVTVSVKFTVGSVTRTESWKVRFVKLSAQVQALTLEGDDEITIKEDHMAAGGTAGTFKTIADPVWKDTYTPDQIGPSAFHKGDDVTVTVTFKLQAPLPVKLDNVRVVGTLDTPSILSGTPPFVPFNFRSDVFSIDAGETTFDVENIKVVWKPLTTMYLNPMRIKWQIVPVKTSGCPVWLPAGTTESPVYYTLSNSFDTTVSRTALHLGVAGVIGDTQEEVFEQVWRKFGLPGPGGGPAHPRTWNNKPLAYYPAGKGLLAIHGMPPTEDNADRLILRGFSGCFGFNGLFKAALRANGFDADTVVVTAKAPATHLLVKDWEFNVVSPGSAPWTSEIELPSIYGGTFWTMIPFSTTYGPAFNKEGKGGQGEPWPSEKFFQNHQIVKWFGVYYDPSYGTRYADANTFQFLSLAGVARPSGVEDVFLVQKAVPGGPILVEFDN